MIENIKDLEDFINSAEIKSSTRDLCISEIVEACIKLGFHDIGLETNGYQIDFWDKLTGEKFDIIIGGCLYYSNEINISKEVK